MTEPVASPERLAPDPLAWERVEDIFARALGLPDAERAAFVAAAASGDAALEREVLALLEADKRSADILDGPGLVAPVPLASTHAEASLIGLLLDGRYRVLRLLGRGGMGAVYEGRHAGTGRRVAIKVIAPHIAAERDIVRRFELEARAAGAIESPHVAQVLDVGVDPTTGSPYLAIEYLSGCDVAALVARLGPLEPSLALRITAQACRGLEKAHGLGVIHRDIKPANLFLAHGEDDLRTVKILDFGIAKLLRQDEAVAGGAAITKSGAILGSPLYMSPEQALGEIAVDHRTDLWSLGIVLFELLTATTPFDRSATVSSLLVAIATAPIPSVRDRAPWVSASVAELVARALRRDRADRFESAAQMLVALRRECSGALDLSAPDVVRFQPPEIAAAPRASTAATGVAGTEILGRRNAEERAEPAAAATSTPGPSASHPRIDDDDPVPHPPMSKTSRWLAVVAVVAVGGAGAAAVLASGGAPEPSDRGSTATAPAAGAEVPVVERDASSSPSTLVAPSASATEASSQPPASSASHVPREAPASVRPTPPPTTTRPNPSPTYDPLSTP